MAGCVCKKCGSSSFVTFSPGTDITKAARNWVCLSCWKKMSDGEKAELENKMKEDM